TNRQRQSFYLAFHWPPEPKAVGSTPAGRILDRARPPGSAGTNLSWRNYHVETIIDCSTDFGVRLRNPERPGAHDNSSTNTDSAKQRHYQRPHLSLACEPAGRLGVRS